MIHQLVNSKTHEVIEDEALRIMYGSIVIPHSKPWVVGLANKNNGKIKCGGVLISNKHVLTALHCMTTKLKRYVIVGEHDQNNTNDGQRYIRINEFHLHPNSTTKYGIYSFDLAILVLEKEIILNDKINIVNMPLPNESCEKLTVNLNGWGIYEPWGYHHTSSQLRTVELACLPESVCNANTFSKAFDPKTMICGGNIEYPKKGSCMGDSGGRLIFYISNKRY